ncbi:MAG: S8 family serine peptidase [Phycisphaerae bacterium]|jgi:hypothetical protein
MNRMVRMTWALLLIGALSIWLAGCAGPGGKTAAPADQPEKIKITKLDDLPQHTYPFTGNVLELIRDDARVHELVTKVRADVEGDLAKYEIDDASTLQGMHATLVTCDLIEGRYDDALARSEKIRELESKEAKKLTGGLTLEATAFAKREAGADITTPAFRKAFRQCLDEKLAKLPWDIVQDDIQQSKGRLEFMSETLIAGIVQGRMQVTVDATGELSDDLAASVLGIHYMLKERLPLKDVLIAAYQQVIDAHQEAKQDIWADRAVTLSPSDTTIPILMAAWDSGTDPEVFADQIWTNPDEVPDGADNDENGYVDDIHGIAFDINANRTTGMLYPLGEVAPRMPSIMKYMKGLSDLQAAVDSPEASALKKHMSELSPEDVNGFIEDLGLAGNYCHGTHVAGLMLDGNPCARLLIGRLSYDFHTIPVARTPDWGRRDGQKCRDFARYFQEHGVRVVNMSWGEALNDIIGSLEKNGIGDTAEQRREIAREVFGYQRDGLYSALKNAPEILFVCAAGNADNDVEFDEDIPSSFDLPNLLVVGAVDQAGEPTSFTAFGGTVQVYANGFEVESYVPGGERMEMSGTSMASPNVANLAGKLLAIDPSLTPPEVIDWIKRGAELRREGDREYLLINPRESVKLLRAHLEK